ncbi:MAG: hypothetical protein JNM03_18185 [Sphingopyxis sp.]|uniref:hypothetical protein n=1 Tax=Sphingopyxis sp. TaxID=1908224 RepID=UPI001A5259FF|nr:hypothetical protein [Sphingopyxis sp.]MBL9071916.1 hypothetical protein [Sphingopyxis sp.]
MKYTILAAALLLGAAAPAAAMTIDADERELYDDSVQCMAFYGIMAGLGGDKDPEDPKAAASGTKFLAVATVLADEDKDQIQADLNKQIAMFGKLAEQPDNPANLERLREIKDSCEFMETLVDAMIAGSS